MAYAIIRTGGKQFRVSPGDVVRVPSIAAKNAGDAVEFDILTSGDDNGIRIGSPTVDGTSVTGTVVRQGRAPKIIVFKFKKRKGFKKTKGHRQGFTEVKIDAIGDRQAEREPEAVSAPVTEPEVVTASVAEPEVITAAQVAEPEIVTATLVEPEVVTTQVVVEDELKVSEPNS